jgi:hypothetical protein
MDQIWTSDLGSNSAEQCKFEFPNVILSANDRPQHLTRAVARNHSAKRTESIAKSLEADNVTMYLDYHEWYSAPHSLWHRTPTHCVCVEECGCNSKGSGFPQHFEGDRKGAGA